MADTPPKCGWSGFAVLSRDPDLMAVGIAIELAIAEVASQQAELPQVIGDVLADVADRAVGAHDDLRVLVGTGLFLFRIAGAPPLSPSGDRVGLGRFITQQPLFFPSVSK